VYCHGARPGTFACLDGQFARIGHQRAASAGRLGARGWLLELYGDGRSAALDDALLECGLLMRSAIRPRPAGRGGSALPQRRTGQVQLLTALAARLADESQDERALLEAALAEVQAAIGADAAGIVRLGDDGRMRQFAAAGAFLEAEDTWSFSQPAGRGLLGRCLRKDRAVLAPDVLAEPDYTPAPASLQLRCELDVPLRVQRRHWGAMSVQAAEPNRFDDEDARLLCAVAD
jgi:putative methionine-R-sulfoxide reductase with GAF domain